MFSSIDVEILRFGECSSDDVFGECSGVVTWVSIEAVDLLCVSDCSGVDVSCVSFGMIVLLCCSGVICVGVLLLVEGVIVAFVLKIGVISCDI